MGVREQLQTLLRERALFFGDFTLAAGQKSTYYINSKKILFHSRAVALLGQLLYEATADLPLSGIGGLEVGAIPMTTAAVRAYHDAGRELEGFFVRKQVKDHGSKERIEGLLTPGTQVAVIDDVLNTGNSAWQAIQAVEEAGAQVARVVCIVDRLAGARERLAGYDFRPLFTIEDFGISPPSPA